MFSFSFQNRGQLLASAVTLSVALAQGKSQEQLELLAAFFTVVADQLALFSLCPDQSSDLSAQGPVNPEDIL